MRPRFSLAEASGAVADLGVLLPLTLALISLNGVNATSAFVGLGLAYLLSALAYRLPIPIQPLKSLAATALALGLSTTVIVAGAWWLALVFLLLALAPVTDRLASLFPPAVVRGIQLGLSYLLLRSAWGLVFGAPAELSLLNVPVAALAAGAVLLLALWRWPAAAGLSVIGVGVVVGLWQQGAPPIALGLAPPRLAPVPSARDFLSALWLLAIPQLPLSLANSVYATRDTARQYFPVEGQRVTPRRLLATMGLSNAVAALLGGIPGCHGSGRLTAHYRLGARTGGAPLLLGLTFLAVGVLGGPGLLPLLGVVPGAVLGVLLTYVGVQHALLARSLRGWAEWAPALAVVVTTMFSRNLALGFGVGLAVHFALRGARLLRRPAPLGVG